MLAVVAILTSSTSFAARTQTIFIGKDIPGIVYTSGSFVFIGSDSLYLNERRLIPGNDYSYDVDTKGFVLHSIAPTDSDTLTVIYSSAPNWLKPRYGELLPTTGGTSEGQNPPLTMPLERPGAAAGQGNIAITGAKTFRFTSQTSGGSNFGQSLDLSISGKFGHNMELTGAVSDRGYDPSYGTANSRLNELDKVNLRLTSDNLTAEVGDITLGPRLNLGAPGQKRVSGVSFLVDEPRWHVTGTAARPKGRYSSAKFQGSDGTQGPYQIGAGSLASPIVPGSETVWLDGQKLTRGANSDYLMDYPAGRITFNVTHPIDSRSRIEIDYEPLATTYRGELLTTEGGFASSDSSFSMHAGVLREGDDKNQLLLGDFSQQDRDLLASVGDHTDSATRSGIRADTLGDYSLVVDSLPDSVYQYVGAGNGQYDITFTFFGTGNGNYRFIGSGRYDFVGEGNGDYRPLIKLPAPQRTDYYVTGMKVRNSVLGEISADFQQSRFNRNLFSSLNDNDNSGAYWELNLHRGWKAHGQENFLKLRTRSMESNFKSRERLYRADFGRDYMLPLNFTASSTEDLREGSLILTPLRSITVSPFYSRLDYRNALTANTGGLNLTLSPADGSSASIGWKQIRTAWDTAATELHGQADLFNAGFAYPISKGFALFTGYSFDRRTNEYSGATHGTRFNQIKAGVTGVAEQLGYEFYREDSLIGDWTRQLTRNRLSLGSSRKIGSFSYGSTITYQWLDNTQSKETDFLSRLDMQYADIRRRLNLSANYVLSDETRNSRGIAYIEVEPGQGSYSLENGQYVPDPDGNYVRVDEILSDKSKVRQGQKVFSLSKVWSVMQVRFNSNIDEELLPEGHRAAWWVLPFLSDETQPYLYYRRRYDSDLRIIPLRSGHAINLSYAEDREIRSIAGDGQRRNDYEGQVKLRQVVKESSFEQGVGLFKNSSDAYYSGGGDISGYELSGTYSQLVNKHELSGTTRYRRAKSDLGELSKLYAVVLESRVQVISKGELRSSLEVYHQDLNSVSGQYASYLLTDNHPGKRGAIWSVALRYGLSSGMRVNFSLSGRHSDYRTSRIVGRGEFVAGF